MIKKFFSRWNGGLVLFFVVLMAASIFLFNAIGTRNDAVRLRAKNQSMSINGWEVNGTPTTFPASLRFEANAAYEFTCVLPEHLNNDQALYYTAHYCSQAVYIGDEPVYTFAVERVLPFGNTQGNAYVVIPMKEEYEGKTIRIVMTNLFSQPLTTSFEEFALGSEGEFKLSLILKNHQRIIVVCVFLAFGLLILIQGILQSRTETGKEIGHMFIYFSCFIMSVSGWLLTDTSIIQFLTSMTVIGQYAAFVFLICFGSFYMGFCACMFKRSAVAFHLIESIGYVLFLAMFVFYVLDIADPTFFMYLIYVYGVACLVCTIVLLIRNLKHSKYALVMLLGTIALIVGVIISIVAFLIDPSATASALPIIIAYGLYLVTLFYLLMRHAQEASKEATKIHVYRTLAYRDQLTGLSNRAAFEKKLDEIETMMQAKHNILLFMIDLNYLKRANDEDGHEAGDEMIRAAANCLSEAFPGEDVTFRLGGDEFACLLVDSPISAEEHLQKLSATIEQANETRRRPLSLAVGHAERKLPLTHYEDLRRAIYQEADEKMYETKIAMKANRVD